MHLANGTGYFKQRQASHLSIFSQTVSKLKNKQNTMCYILKDVLENS